jgi:hypothetical protein
MRFWGANERRPQQRWWAGGRRGGAPRSAGKRRRLEQLEDRLVPSTLTVLNLNDSGAGSLRDVVAAAAAGDPIDFAVTGVITLTSGELAVNQNLTISGPGASVLAVSGNDASRIFNVGPTATMDISNLTLTAGNAVTGGGSAGPQTAVRDRLLRHGTKAAGN